MSAQKTYTVLSLFDGMSCGQIALRELGVRSYRYYASDIDRHAIAQAQLNFPDTVQLGDVEQWRAWDVDWASVDLILAGSPCQGFSVAGKGLAFSDPRSRLFFTFVDILRHVQTHNKNVKFLLENVVMKKSHQRVISDALKLQPVCISSALVSAQLRKRLYWSNIKVRRDGLFGDTQTDIPQPKDRGILLKDILEEHVPERYFLRGKTLARILKEMAQVDREKAYCLSTKNSTTGYGNPSTMTVVSVPGAGTQMILQRARGFNDGGILHEKTPTLSASSYEHNNLVFQLNPSRESCGQQPYQGYRVYDVRGKAPAHVAEMSAGSYAINDAATLRRLTPTECARLQTIPDWYKWNCSDTQQYKMLGNGWTVEVIKHILSFNKQLFNNS
jgi:DNA (cytosine-5)-methyltransferase 3A